MRFLSFTLVIVGLLLAGCDEAGNNEKPLNTEPVETKSPPKNKIGQALKIDEEIKQFWQLVAQQKSKEAVNLANTLVKDNSGEVVAYYKDLFTQEGIKDSVITRKEFNDLDFFFWVQAQFFKSLSNELVANSTGKNLIEVLYEVVSKQVLQKGDVQDLGVYPIHIWNRKFGACDRQSWVVCELAYQNGARTSIIYLIDPITKESPHTICEVYFKGEHYIIDVLNQKFLQNTKFTDLTQDKIKEIWKENPNIHDAFKNAVRLVPSMPIDYSERNQRLNARLGKLIKFAEPPQNRYHFWKQLYPSQDIRFWEYPIRILKNTEFYKNAEK